MTDFAFLANLDASSARSRRQHMQDIQRDSLRRKLEHIANDCEEVVDHCRDLIRSGANVSDELHDMEAAARGLLLVTLLLKREVGIPADVPQAAE